MCYDLQYSSHCVPLSDPKIICIPLYSVYARTTSLAKYYIHADMNLGALVALCFVVFASRPSHSLLVWRGRFGNYSYVAMVMRYLALRSSCVILLYVATECSNHSVLTTVNIHIHVDTSIMNRLVTPPVVDFFRDALI